MNTHEAAAELHARRFYKADHFGSQVGAERAYFRVLAESLARGREIARLARLVSRARLRNKQAKAREAALVEALRWLDGYAPGGHCGRPRCVNCEKREAIAALLAPYDTEAKS